MCITEYNEQLHLELEREIAEKRGREQGREQGLKQGLKQGREQGLEQGLKRGSLLTLADLVQDGIITLAQAAKKAKMTKKEFEAKLKALQSEPQLT